MATTFFPGLTFRPIHGAEDAAALHAVQTGRAAHDGMDPLSAVERIPTREQLAEALAGACAQGRQHHWRVAEVDGRVVGYARTGNWVEADGTWVYLHLGWVLPAWRGQGIGTSLLRWAEARIRELAATEHPRERCEYAANASSTETEATALLLHEGYRPAYTVVGLELDPAAPASLHPLPAGLEVRPVTPDQIPAITRCVLASFQDEYPGGRYQENEDPDSYANSLRDARHDPVLWQVAWAGDQPAGAVLSVVEPGRAEVFEVAVLPAFRRRGLGRALMTRALAALRGRGVAVIRIHTVREFPTRAIDLYQSLGFRPFKEFPRYRKPMDER